MRLDRRTSISIANVGQMCYNSRIMNEAKLNLRLTPELLDAARKESKRRKLTLSDWIRGVMTEAIGGPLLPSKKRSSTKAKRTRR